MPKTIRIAAVQMNAKPAPTAQRLVRAQELVASAARQGAQLIVLPELFNTGYEYSPENFLRAETLDGLTAAWMRKTTAQFQIHLAGSFLHRAQGEIYNTLLLAARDGAEWLYNKHHPWFWERAYFQPGKDITIAHTSLGKIGLLICWDVAHTPLWQQYAGKVELMAVCSCPPKALDLSLVFPDGQKMQSRAAGALTQYLKRSTDPTFGEYLRRQSAWLGVPMVNTTAAGIFSTAIPHPKRSVSLIALMVPRLWKYRTQFAQARMQTGYFLETTIANAAGEVLQRVAPELEDFALSEVTLADDPPQPNGKQPPFGIPSFTCLFDTIVNNMLASEYRKHTLQLAINQER